MTKMHTKTESAKVFVLLFDVLHARLCAEGPSVQQKAVFAAQISTHDD
jgi:hypothetical protein